MAALQSVDRGPGQEERKLEPKKLPRVEVGAEILQHRALRSECPMTFGLLWQSAGRSRVGCSRLSTNVARAVCESKRHRHSLPVPIGVLNEARVRKGVGQAERRFRSGGSEVRVAFLRKQVQAKREVPYREPAWPVS